MVTVKLSTIEPTWDFKRQTPKSASIWQNYFFSIDQKIDFCDYWVVYEGIKEEETCVCRPQNIFLITGEPPTIKTYHPTFLKQSCRIHRRTFIFPSLLSSFFKIYSYIYTYIRILKNIYCYLLNLKDCILNTAPSRSYPN